jgi:hypothetical protein
MTHAKFKFAAPAVGAEHAADNQICTSIRTSSAADHDHLREKTTRLTDWDRTRGTAPAAQGEIMRSPIG